MKDYRALSTYLKKADLAETFLQFEQEKDPKKKRELAQDFKELYDLSFSKIPYDSKNLSGKDGLNIVDITQPFFEILEGRFNKGRRTKSIIKRQKGKRDRYSTVVEYYHKSFKIFGFEFTFWDYYQKERAFYPEWLRRIVLRANKYTGFYRRRPIKSSCLQYMALDIDCKTEIETYNTLVKIANIVHLLAKKKLILDIPVGCHFVKYDVGEQGGVMLNVFIDDSKLISDFGNPWSHEINKKLGVKLFSHESDSIYVGKDKGTDLFRDNNTANLDEIISQLESISQYIT